MNERATFNRPIVDELRRLSAQFSPADDAAWRLERMYGYLAWLKTGEAPPPILVSARLERPPYLPFDPVLDVRDEALRRELSFWQMCETEGLVAPEILAAFAEMLADAFGTPPEVAGAEVSTLKLAEGALPIWNLEFGCLVPEHLGPWRLYLAENNEPSSPGLGTTYHYRHASVGSTLSLYLYGGALHSPMITPDDPVVASELAGVCREIDVSAANTGSRVTWYAKSIEEVISSRSGRKVSCRSATWLLESREARSRVGAISLIAFRGGFLKLRLSGPQPFVESDSGQGDIADLNVDLADFVERDGP